VSDERERFACIVPRNSNKKVRQRNGKQNAFDSKLLGSFFNVIKLSNTNYSRVRRCHQRQNKVGRRRLPNTGWTPNNEDCSKEVPSK